MQAEGKEEKRLKELLEKYAPETVPMEVQKEKEYQKILFRNFLYGAAACAVGVWLAVLGVLSIGLILALPGSLFLAGTFVWYHTKRERIRFWNREQTNREEKRASVVLMMDTTGRRRGEISRSVQSGQPVRCRNGLGAGNG